MTQLLILMQGPPGSGKTTMAKWLSPLMLATVVSTDDFHTCEDGVYRFE